MTFSLSAQALDFTRGESAVSFLVWYPVCARYCNCSFLPIEHPLLGGDTAFRRQRSGAPHASPENPHVLAMGSVSYLRRRR